MFFLAELFFVENKAARQNAQRLRIFDVPVGRDAKRKVQKLTGPNST
jgi:hypothetical protein